MAEVSLREPSAAQEKTFVSVFHELCTKFGFGLAMYNLKDQQGEAHRKTFLMSLTVDMLGVSGNTFNCYKLKLEICNNVNFIYLSPVEGIGMTKMQAKHDAAHKMMVQIRDTFRAGGTLNNVPRAKLLSCCEWFEEFVSFVFHGIFY